MSESTILEKRQKRLIVIGGGAAGFFCAVNAARLHPSLEVIIVEKTSKLLAKVRVSGGGRCNVTHACFDVPALVKKYPRGTNLLKKAFYQFDTTKCVEWFSQRGVTLKTEADGRMFPVTDSSQAVIDCLLQEANKYRVEISLNSEIADINRGETGHVLTVADGRTLHCTYVCIATGGYPKATMYQWLTRLGHTITSPVPSLFTFNMPGNTITALMGVAVAQASVKVVGSKLADEGPLLITHWGMSGPAVLKLSAWGARELADKQYHFSILVNWAINYNEQSLRDGWQTIRNDRAVQKIGNRNPFALPSRLWIYLLNESGINEDITWANLPGKEQNKLIKNLCAQEFEVKGKTTFKEEFVTCGGIELSEIDAASMESRIVANLFFAGETMNVDGVTGGFNFQHAWTSGWIAAKTISEKAMAD